MIERGACELSGCSCELNKQTGGILRTFQAPGLAGMPNAWAFAFWGGDFWIILKRSSDPSTTVWHSR